MKMMIMSMENLLKPGAAADLSELLCFDQKYSLLVAGIKAADPCVIIPFRVPVSGDFNL